MLTRFLALGIGSALILSPIGCKKDEGQSASTEAKTNTPATKPGAAPAQLAADPAAAAPKEGVTAEQQASAEAPVPSKAADTKPAAEAPAAGIASAEKAAPEAAAADTAAEAKADVPAKDVVKDAATKAREEMEARRKRIQEIYTYGRSKEPGDAAKLKAIIIGEGPVYERASAIRALGRDKRDGVIPELKTMVEDKATAVRIEAAIKLYQWDEQRFAMPVLKKLRKQGVALRRAFQTGFEKGKPTYDKNALPFFRDGVKAENVYVRLDSAVGLIELGKENKGLPVIKGVLTGEEKYHIRMAAVNYLTPLKTNEKVRGLLDLATKDKDERVAKRARDVLGVSAPKKAVPAKPAADTKPAVEAKTAVEAKPAAEQP